MIQGSAIRTARQSRGMSANDAAKELQVSPKKLKRIEEDNYPCPPELIVIMSRIFHYPESFFEEKIEKVTILGCRGCCGSLAPESARLDLEDIKYALAKYLFEHPHGEHEFSCLPEAFALVQKELGKV